MTAGDPQISDWVGLASEGTPVETIPEGRAREVRYRLGGELGTGGMGRVRAAYDTRLAREIAVKHVRAEGDATAEAALLREARVTAGLDHPGIIAVLDAGRDEQGAPFYAMRVVHGDSLEAIVARALDEEARTRLVRALLQVAQAIAHAHARGVVHRDLSPRNIRIGTHGEVVVMDWGLAAGCDDAARGGDVCGTPGFRAPELAHGEPAGPPADVWSLGALLHLVLAGSPPGPALPRRLPAPLRSLLARALSPSAPARYPDARALAQDLAAYLDGGRVEAHAERLWDRLARLARRHPSTVLASTVGLTAVTIVALVLGTIAVRRRDEARRAQVEAREALRALVVPRASEAVRDDRRDDAEQLAVSARELGDEAAARGALAAFAASGRIAPHTLGGEDGCRTLDVRGRGARLCTRGTELWLVDGSERHRIELGTVEPSAARFLTDGGILVVADRVTRLDATRRVIATYALTGGIPQVDHAAGWAFVAVPDLYLAIAPDGRARDLRPCASGVPIRMLAAIPSTPGASVALCADGSLVVDGARPTRVSASELFTQLPAAAAGAVLDDKLVLGGPDGRIGLVELGTGRVVHAARGPVGAITRIGRTAWGDVVVVGTEGLGLWQPEAGAWRHVVTRAHATDATSTGDEVIAFGAGTLHAWPRAPGRAVHELRALGGLSTVAWSADGTRAAFGGGDGVLHVLAFESGHVRRAVIARHVIKSLAFSPDGATLALGVAEDAGIQVIDVTTLGRRARPVVERAMRARRIAYLTPGVLVGFTYHARPTGYDLATGEPVAIAPLSDAIVDVATPAAPGTIFALDARGAIWRYHGRGQDPLRAAPGAVALAVSADGRTIAVTTAAGALAVRDAHTDVTRATLAVPGAEVTTIALSPSGDRLALGRLDGAVEVWTVTPQRCELVVHAHGGRVGAVAFAPDGCTLATAGWDAVGRVLTLCEGPAGSTGPPLRSR